MSRPRVNWQLTTGFGPPYIRSRLEPDLIFRTGARIYIFSRIYVWNWKRDHSNLFLRKNQNRRFFIRVRRALNPCTGNFGYIFLAGSTIEKHHPRLTWRLGTRFWVLDSLYRISREDFFFPQIAFESPVTTHCTTCPFPKTYFWNWMTFGSYFVVFSPCPTAISNCFQCPTQAFELHEKSPCNNSLCRRNCLFVWCITSSLRLILFKCLVGPNAGRLQCYHEPKHI